MTNLVDRVIKRLMEAYDVHDEGALAMQVGRGVVTFRVWRNRDIVPLEVIVEASQATGYSIDWLQCRPNAVKSASTKTPHDDRHNALLTERELALLNNYRAVDESGRAAVELTCAALAKPSSKKKLI